MTLNNDTASLDVEHLLAILHRSHERFAGTLAGLDAAALGGPSYHSWTIAQVASHLGSGAEISGLRLAAGLDGSDQPGVAECQPIWDRWDAKAPAQQAADGVTADREFLDQADALPPEQRDTFKADIFGSQLNLAEFLRTRVAEHAVHTWDITVALDPESEVAEDAVPVVVDNLAGAVGWSAKYVGDPIDVDVRLTDPDRHWRLRLDAEGSRLEMAADDDGSVAPASVLMPAESFLRLVYGRFDADHTPASVTATGIDLDVLRATFPGF